MRMRDDVHSARACALQGQVHTLLTLRYLIGQFERFMFLFPVVFY